MRYIAPQVGLLTLLVAVGVPSSASSEPEHSCCSTGGNVKAQTHCARQDRADGHSCKDDCSCPQCCSCACSAGHAPVAVAELSVIEFGTCVAGDLVTPVARTFSRDPADRLYRPPRLV